MVYFTVMCLSRLFVTNLLSINVDYDHRLLHINGIRLCDEWRLNGPFICR